MNENKDNREKDKLLEMLGKFTKRANQTIEIRNHNPKPSTQMRSKKRQGSAK